MNGRRAGLLASVGIALGLAIHIIYSAAGLAAVVAHSAHWMTAIKLRRRLPAVSRHRRTAQPRRCARRGAGGASGGTHDLAPGAGGFLCNALNPKAPIYFLALFTVVLSPGLPLPTLLAYGAWIMILQWSWFSLVALLFAHRLVRDRLLAVRHWIDRAFGVAMVALGIRVLARSA